MKRKKQFKKTLSVNLLLEGRYVLVVGCGKVVQHKLVQLSASGAEIVVIAPEICPVALEMKEQGLLNIIQREFQDSDLDDKFIVLAGTNNNELNKYILELAHSKGILCGAVDENWVNGDFVSPAVIRHGKLSVAISSGGVSCRLSRIVKETLKARLDKYRNSELVVIGINHKRLDLENLEKFILFPQEQERVIQALMHITGIHEFVLVVTCNRVEFWGVVALSPIVRELINFALGFDKMAIEASYCYRGFEAFSHTAFSLCGFYSQTLGEKHIVSQVKNALQQSKDNGAAGTILNEWHNSALHISRQMRQKIEPVFQNYELEDLVRDYLKSFFEDNLKSPKIAILGTGVIGSNLLDILDKSFGDVTCGWYRNKANIGNEKPNVKLLQMQEIIDNISKYDAVICATSSEDFILKKEMQSFFNNDKKVCLIDLCNPRNIDPELKSNNIEVVNLEDLKYWLRREKVELDLLEKECRKILLSERDLYDNIALDIDDKELFL